MLLMTYVPYNEDEREENIECYQVESPEDIIVSSVQHDFYKPELLCVFRGFSPIVSEIPESALKIQVGEVVLGEAFLCDELQRETFPEIGKEKRKKAKEYLVGKSLRGDTSKKEVKIPYEDYLKEQKKAFEMFFLPTWADHISSFFGIKADVGEESAKKEIGFSGYEKIRGAKRCRNASTAIVRGSVRKMYPNDVCYCGSGLKYKKCHGRL